MDQATLWILVVGAALLVAGVAAWYVLARRRRERLRSRFGPEYDRTVREAGGVGAAAAALEARERRVATLDLRPLSPEDGARFRAEWRRLQIEFVDRPERTVTEADRLVGEVMSRRGYPLGDFEQRVADISVDHPGVVMNYRAAREIAVMHVRGQATTEDLRQAMVHYRALFEDLFDTGAGDRDAAVDDRAPEWRGR